MTASNRAKSRIVTEEMGGPLPYPEDSLALDGDGKKRPYNQTPRLQVRVSPFTKKSISGVFIDRKGQQKIIDVAMGIGLQEAFMWLSKEHIEKGMRWVNITLTPTEALLRKAQKFCVNPHILIRAAAVKLACEVEEERAAERVPVEEEVA